MEKIIWRVGGGVVVIGIIVLLFVVRNDPNRYSGFLNRTETPPPADEPPAAQTVTMRMKDGGYEPANLTVAVETTITFVNDGANEHWPASNIHPTHEIYPEFDPQRAVPPGESWSFTFDKAGIWRYQDHLSPNLKGTITVNE